MFSFLKYSISFAITAIIVVQTSFAQPLQPQSTVRKIPPQKWVYKNGYLCMPPAGTEAYQQLVEAKFNQLGENGFELVSIIEYQVPKPNAAKHCFYAVFKKPKE